MFNCRISGIAIPNGKIRFGGKALQAVTKIIVTTWLVG